MWDGVVILEGLGEEEGVEDCGGSGDVVECCVRGEKGFRWEPIGSWKSVSWEQRISRDFLEAMKKFMYVLGV